MNQPLRHTPAYIGLFASLFLALACNAFLDIQYGGFGFEVICWGLLFAGTTYIGWRQRGGADDSGKGFQKAVLLLGLALTVLVFMPIWGFPRAGLYMLAMLQASQNCVTTSRRQLHLGLLVSAVMVMFAASHARADWTMLFYLLPYVVAVVFTLVSEQISRRAESVRESSLGDAGVAGQGLAVAAATAIILCITAVLYAVTPQVSWPYLESTFGQPSTIGRLGESQESGGAGQGGSTGSSGGESAGGELAGTAPWRGLPGPAQMREAAGRAGMPEWQRTTILKLADLSEAMGDVLAPIAESLDEMWSRFREWMEKNRKSVMAGLLLLILAALLIALFRLLRELKWTVWLRARFDYWYLVRLGRYPTGVAGAILFYRATERLLLLSGVPRLATANTREFLRDASHYRDGIRAEMFELTGLFERFRYGCAPPVAADLARMRQLYAAIFLHLTR